MKENKESNRKLSKNAKTCMRILNAYLKDKVETRFVNFPDEIVDPFYELPKEELVLIILHYAVAIQLIVNRFPNK